MPGDDIGEIGFVETSFDMGRDLDTRRREAGLGGLAMAAQAPRRRHGNLGFRLAQPVASRRDCSLPKGES